MRVCPQHENCRWFDVERPDSRGADLGYGDGWRNGRDFAEAHEPMLDFDYPISNCRGDDFAFGFYDGCIAQWCPKHHQNSDHDHDFTWRGMSNSYCFSHRPCKLAVEEMVRSAHGADATT